MPRLLCLLTLAALPLAGCASGSGTATDLTVAPASARDELEPPPLRAELPDLTARRMQSLPVSAGVETYERQFTAPSVIPKFKPVEPTPTERAILGEPEEEEEIFDELVFYRPERGPEQGVLPIEGEITGNRTLDLHEVSAVYDMNRNASGVLFRPRFDRAPIGGFDRTISSVYSLPGRRGAIYTEQAGAYGVELDAGKAAAAPVFDP